MGKLISENPEAILVAKRIFPLLIEFTGKARALSIVAIAHSKDSRKRLLPALRELGSTTSQLIEYGAIDDVTRIELRLRLAELEAALVDLEKGPL